MPKTICAFIIYDTSTTLSYYLKKYIEELVLHFDEVVIVTNERALEEYYPSEVFSDSGNSAKRCRSLTYQYEKNEGYDFGMFYKFWRKLDLSAYREIALINDSNILLNPLDKTIEKGRAMAADLWGLIDSIERPIWSTHRDNYHIQSHFLFFNQSVFGEVNTLINSIKDSDIFSADDIVKLKNKVINDWEIGLTQTLKQKGFQCVSLFDSEQFLSKANIKEHFNVPLIFAEQLMNQHYPVLKKSIITTPHLLPYKIKWLPIVEKNFYKGWDLKALVSDLEKRAIEAQKNYSFFRRLKNKIKFLRKKRV